MRGRASPEEAAVYHTIEFTVPIMVGVEVARHKRMERLCLRRGDRMLAQLRPSVVETPNGPVEVADLDFADGTTARSIPYAAFFFVD